MALASKCLRARVQAPRITAGRVTRKAAVTVRASGTPYPQNWLQSNPIVLPAAFLGWTIPSNIPVSAFGGKSLFGLFTESIGSELSHFPTGPALTDDFWLLLITWHVGLFVTLVLGQVGVQGRKQGYW